ncbi:MAG: helix-turn-helix domain-containing protein [Taibaiella sp.]|nr:helix-turn-helix domain-containing protein [Taibaiella sp.]
MSSIIPIHDFTKDDSTSIPFRYIPLNARSAYDTTLPHRHNYYEIIFFTNGGGRHVIDFKEHPIKDHSIHFVSPGQVHQLVRDETSFGTIIIFSRELFYQNAKPDNSLFSYPFLNNNYFPVIELTGTEEADLEIILNQIAGEFEDQKCSLAIIQAYLQVILLKCMRVFERQYTEWEHTSRSQFYDFRLLVEKGFRSHKLPSYYSNELNITERKLNEVCKDATGHNVGVYIKERILLEAKRLLYNSDSRMKEIADFLGFEDPSYFNRFFKSNVGITAGDFRKKDK